MSYSYNFYVYILASRHNGTLYIGVTNDLDRRVKEHKEGAIKGFTHKYSVHNLVYFEWFTQAKDAILREKELKGKKREYKMSLIAKENPEWRDLSVQKNLSGNNLYI